MDGLDSNRNIFTKKVHQNLCQHRLMIDNFILDKDCFLISDFVAIQQNSNALDQYANEGIKKLNNFVAYKNDEMLINATKQVLECSPVAISFLMLNQKVTENKKIMDSKSQKDLTTIEIDAYNKLIIGTKRAIIL